MSASWPTASSRKLARAEHRAGDPLAASLVQALSCLPRDARLVIAFSGGVDSVVLLHACAVLGRDLIACHVHHGLQTAADAFADHCRAQAERLGVPYVIKRLQGAPARGDSVEAWARDQRYAALIDCVRETQAQALVTAHHADDQAETLLIRLSRGSGPRGLLGIEAASQRDGVPLLRPFLRRRRAEIEAYAARHALAVIDDPMNAEARWLRVGLRTKVMPALGEVAPSFVANVGRSAALLAEAVEVVSEVARGDLEKARLSGSYCLDLAKLVCLSPARRANALRHWLAELGAPPPSQARLAALLTQSFESRSAHALWRSEQWSVVRYRRRLQAFGPGALPGPGSEPPAPMSVRWRGEERIELRPWGLAICFSDRTSQASAPAQWVVSRARLEAGPVSVAAPESALRLRSDPGAMSRPVRKHWQLAGTPPWLRPWIPALAVAGEVIGIPGFGVTDRGIELRDEDGPGVAVRFEAIDPQDPRREWEIAYT